MGRPTRDTGHGEALSVVTAHGRVHAEVEGSGPVVLLASGGPGVPHDHYHPWFSRLAQDCTVVYLDYLGTGRSDRLVDPSQYTVATYAECLDAVRNEIGAETVSVIGLSFGGFAAVEFGLRWPSRLRSLVLSNAQVSARGWQEGNIDGVNAELGRLFPETWRELLDLRARGITSLDSRYQELVATVLPDLEWVEPWDHARLAGPEEPSFGFDETTYAAIIGSDPEWIVDGTLAGYDPLPRLREIPAATLVVTGRYDRLTPPHIALTIFDALAPDRRELRIFERSAHRPWVEEPDLYFETVGAFLVR